MSINDKFGKNRSKFRKVYSYGLSKKPEIRSFFDPLTNTTKSFDFQKIIRDRDYFLINQFQQLSFPPPDAPAVEFLEVTIGTFSSSIYQDISFPTPFSGTPYLAFETSQSQFTGTDGEETPLIAWWVTNLNSTGFRANFSAPFTGKITYRGVYTPGPYPVYVNRATDLSGAFAWCSAGEVNVGGGSFVTMSWTALPDNPSHLSYNPVGNNSDTDLDIGQNISAVTSSYAVNDLSVPFNGVIQFVALSNTSGSYFQANPDTGIPGLLGFNANQDYPNQNYSSSGLLAWYRFETASGSYTYADNGPTGLYPLVSSMSVNPVVLSSDVNNNFASRPGTPYENIKSAYIQGISSANNTLICPVPGAFEFSGSDFSISAHVKFDSLPDVGNPIVWRGLSGPSFADWEMLVGSDGTLRAGVFNNFSGDILVYRTGTGLITTGSWYHVGCVFDIAAKSFDLYINGAAVSSVVDLDTGWTTFNNSPTSEFRVGQLRDDDYLSSLETNADLKIDQLAIYNRQLTPAEMLVLYNGVVT